MGAVDSARRTLEDRIRNLELKNCQYDPWFYASQREIQKAVPLEVGQGGILAGGPIVPMIFDVYF